MEKQLALMFILFIQPVFAYLVWFSMDMLFGNLGLEGSTQTVVALSVAAILYGIFCYFFTLGFLSSEEAKKLGF